MTRKRKTMENNVVNLSALDIFANGVGALAFLLLLFAANAIELAQPTPLKILTKRVPVSQAGTEYIGILSAVGGVSPYFWSIRSGSLPEGLELNQDRGEIIGASSYYTEGRSYPFEVEVSDSRKNWARAHLEIRVLPRKRAEEARAQPLVLLTHGELPDALIDSPYAIYLSARGGSGQYSWSVEDLPEGFTVEPTSGLLKGIPQASKTHELVITVRDVNCYATKLTKQMISGRAQVRSTVAEWWVELTAEIENEGRAKATNVQWQAELIIGQGDSAVSLQAGSPRTRRGFNLASKEAHPLAIRFQREELPQEKSKLYPNSPYRLEYTYSCAERSRSQKAAANGRLTKADWIILPSIDAIEPQRFIRSIGFHG